MKYHLLIYFFINFYVNICHADIYKWTDAHGQIHFSDQSTNAPNTEKINNQESQINPHYVNNSEEKEDDVLLGYIDDIMNKAKEIDDEANSCYNHAINKNEFDISCKNYNTLLERDFKPLVKKVTVYIKENPLSKASKEQVDEKLNDLQSLSADAEEKYNKAVKYLEYLSTKSHN